MLLFFVVCGRYPSGTGTVAQRCILVVESRVDTTAGSATFSLSVSLFPSFPPSLYSISPLSLLFPLFSLPSPPPAPALLFFCGMFCCTHSFSFRSFVCFSCGPLTISKQCWMLHVTFPTTKISSKILSILSRKYL